MGVGVGPAALGVSLRCAAHHENCTLSTGTSSLSTYVHTPPSPSQIWRPDPIFPGAYHRPHPSPIAAPLCRRVQVPGAKLFPAGGVGKPPCEAVTHTIALYSTARHAPWCRQHHGPPPSSSRLQADNPPATRRGTARSSDAAMIWHHTTTADRGGLRTYAEGLTS